jgi:hypothetical protein
MLQTIVDLPAGVIGMRAVGDFTTDDFIQVIEPALAAVERAHEELRLVLVLGPEFTGFGEGTWGELTNEIRRTHFHRGAVVTDDGGTRTSVNVLKWVLHGDVRTFRNREYGEAVDWVAG